MAANVVKEKCIMCLNDEESSEEGSSWIDCISPYGRWYHQRFVGMDEEDIGSLSEEMWVYSACFLGVLLGSSVWKEESCDIGKGEECWLGSMWIRRSGKIHEKESSVVSVLDIRPCLGSRIW